MNSASKLPHWLWRLGFAIILLVTGWIVVACRFPGAGVLSICIVVGSGILSVRWRSVLPLIAIIFNPMGISFGLGALEWFKVKPHFEYMGLPNHEFFNLDPDTRCYRSTGGCRVFGDEWLIQGPHNAGLLGMVYVLGAPRQTYHGPYPSQEDAARLTESSPETPKEFFLQGKVVCDGKELVLGQDTVQKLLHDCNVFFFEDGANESSQTVKATLFQKRCLIVRVAAKGMTLDKSERSSDGIVLFDIDTRLPFARYILSGYAPRIPALLDD